MTCRISLVLAYSMVAFQWRNVWKWIWSSRGFWSLLAILRRALVKVDLMVFEVGLPNM